MIPKLPSSLKGDKNDPKKIDNNIFGLLTAIVKAHSSLMPVVYANESEHYKPCNKRRYKDLPIYDSSVAPIEDCYWCSSNIKVDKKIVHAAVFSSVRHYRKKVQKTLVSLRDGAYEVADIIEDGIYDLHNAITDYFRQDCRYTLRQGLVAAATGTGMYFGSPRRGLIYRRLIGGSLGYIASGYLCFPESTSKMVNKVSYKIYSTVIPLINWWFNAGIQLIEHDCSRPPKCPQKRKQDKCDIYNEEKRNKENAWVKKMEDCRSQKEQEEIARKVKELCEDAKQKVAEAERRFEEEKLEIQEDLMEKIKYEEAIADRKVEIQNRKLRECKRTLKAKERKDTGNDGCI